jgi:hypothetical protein
MINKLVSWIKSNQIIIIILIVGAFLRLFHLDFQSVWLDEIHTLNESNPKFSFKEVHYSLMISEPHPPLYFFIMNIFFKIFGYTTFVARLFSALTGIAGIYAIYLLGKELFSKKAGIYAMILLSVNYFHIYYSQDARMYVLLFLTTTLSFYFLTRLLKNPTIKSVIFFSLVSTLMIYSHFFALFTLIAQYLILLYYILFPFNISRLKFLKYTFLSGIITVLLYVPTYKLIIKTTQMQSIWIQMPSLDVYTQFFKDFFGQSEMILFFIVPILVLYFIKLFSINNTKKFVVDPSEHKTVFSFIILFSWILITLLIPLIRTYTSLPMLVNRYFINILPAVLIILGIGLYLIKNKIIRYGMILILFIFSISDIFIVKSYYTNPTKTQFREGSNFIIENNNNKTKVVTSLGWYFNYFLKNDKVNYEIVDKPLDAYIEEISNDTANIQAFWYIDAHGRTYNPTQATIDFLEKHFYVEKNLNGHDVWVKKYELIKNKPKVDISKLNLKIRQSIIQSNVEVFEKKENMFVISGWAYVKGIESKTNRVELFLINDTNQINVQSEQIIRKDITSFFKDDNVNYDMSGFEAKINLDKIPKGDYKLGIYIANVNEKIEEIKVSDLIIKN